MILLFWETVGIEKAPMEKTAPFYRRNSYLYKEEMLYTKVFYLYIRNPS